jgi:hypothetical protein
LTWEYQAVRHSLPESRFGDLDDLFAVVISAVLADPVRELGLLTVGAKG